MLNCCYRPAVFEELELQGSGRVCVARAEMYCKIVMLERAMESLVVQGAQKNRPNYVQVK